MAILSKRQQSVLEVIKNYQLEFGMSPSVRDICEILHLNSPSGIHRILKILIDKEYLIDSPGKNRSWRLLDSVPSQSIPLLGNIAAGFPINSNDHQEHLPIDPMLFGYDACFALTVCGDSMMDRHIVDGDIAIIYPQQDVNNGEIAAIRIDNILPEVTLKIVHKKKSSIELHSANVKFKPFVFSASDCQHFHIIGKLIGVVRRDKK